MSYEITNYDKNHVELEQVIFDRCGIILSWQIRSEHCGGLIEQDLEMLRSKWPASWKRMADKIEERLSEIKAIEYRNNLLAKIQSLFDQDKDDKAVS
jgi:hypothetical protein